MLDSISVLILTYNESPNIKRTLSQLAWAKDIVIVDSFSTDDTVDIVSSYPSVRLFQREFDSHTKQWNFGLKKTDISSEWVLALDADYYLTVDLITELEQLKPSQEISGYEVSFFNCVHGEILHGGLYTPVTVLYRREHSEYIQDGHTQRVSVEGRVGKLNGKILHDDRKPLSRWLNSQGKYASLEVANILERDWKALSWPDKVRRMRLVAPFVVFFYCLFFKKGFFNGRAGIYYAFQRMLFETLLSLELIEHDIKKLKK